MAEGYIKIKKFLLRKKETEKSTDGREGQRQPRSESSPQNSIAIRTKSTATLTSKKLHSHSSAAPCRTQIPYPGRRVYHRPHLLGPERVQTATDSGLAGQHRHPRFHEKNASATGLALTCVQKDERREGLDRASRSQPVSVSGSSPDEVHLTIKRDVARLHARPQTNTRNGS